MCVSSISPIASAREDDGPSGPSNPPAPVPDHPVPDHPVPDHPSYPGPSNKPDNPGPSNKPDNPGDEPDNPGEDNPDDPGGDDPDNPGGDEPDNPGTPSGPSGPTIIQYICQCTHDPEQQFYPTVGTLNSINTSIDLVDVFADKESSGTAWTPSLVELPGIGDTIANTYKYGVLYTGAWDTPAVDNKSDHSIKVKGEKGDVDCLFWPSWPYAPRIQLSHSNENKNTNVFGKTTDSEDEIRLHGTVSTSPEGDYVQKTYYDEEKGVIVDKPYLESATPYVEPEPPKDEDSENDSSPIPSLQLSGDSADDKSTTEKDKKDTTPKTEVFSLWTYDTWQNTQGVYTPNAQYASYMSNVLESTNLSEDAKRALNILGYDILYRDEYITRIHEDRYWSFGYYYDSMLDTYINQETKKVTKNPLTQDYIVQCLYRVMGQENVETSLFFFCDAKLAVDFSPIAETLTVSVDKVNEAQNRVDAFVTRCNLDEYWKRAVDEGLVKETGDTTYIISNLKKAPNVQSITVDGKSHVVAADEENDPIIVDTARRQQLTVAEFCELAYKFMHAYGEEVMTEQEQELLLLTYGSLLPYETVSDSQMEAIKYMMAKGIVESGTAWNDLLNLDTMLTILMRIADKSSRLTFKDIDIVYDASLLEQGYYPTKMKISNEESFGIVGMTTTTDYNLKDSEWVDFFLRQSNNVKLNDTTVSTAFREGSNIDATIPQSKVYLGYKLSENGSYVKNNGRDYESIQYVETVTLNDNCKYDHYKIKTTAIYETNKDGTINFSKFNDDYVNRNNQLVINTATSSDRPCYYRVSAYGGIFCNPKAVNTTDDESDGDNKGTGYVIYYTTTHYNNFAVSWQEVKLKPEDGVNAYDYEALTKVGGSIYSVLETDSNGYVLRYMKITQDKHTNDKLHFTFDEAGKSIEYIDHARLIGGYAKSLYENPYLSSSEEEEDSNPSFVEKLASVDDKYDVTFRVKRSTTDAKCLSGDIYWGETKVVAKEDPKSIISNDAVIIKYAYKRDNFYYYTVDGAFSEQEVRQNVKVDDKSYVDDVFVGYLERNKTILVPSSTLLAFLGQESTWNNSFEGGHVLEISKDVILLSFDAANKKYSASDSPGIFNIYLDNARHLISVNNTIYSVPADEIVFSKMDDTSSDYLINWRVVSGWHSGYSVKCTKNGDVELSVNAKDAVNTDKTDCINAYTGLTNALEFTQFKNEKDIPVGFGINMTSPCTTSTWLIYSGDEGDYLFIFKADDSKASNPVYTNLTDEEKSQYALGASLFNDLLDFGISDNTLCMVYSLEIYNNAIVTTDPTDVNKMYLTDEGTWVYLAPDVSDIVNIEGIQDKFVSKSKVFGDIYSYDKNSEEDPEFKRDNKVVSALNSLHEAYYRGSLLLPIVCSDLSTSTVWDISTNVIEGCEYGATPAVAFDSDFKGLSTFIDYADSHAQAPGLGASASAHLAYPIPVDFSDYKKNAFDFTSKNISYVPYGIVTMVMNTTPYKTSDLVWKKGSDTVTFAYMGNYRGAFSGNKLKYSTALSGGPTIDLPETVSVISMSAYHQYVSTVAVPMVYLDSSSSLTDEVAQSKLGDAEQPTYVDWGKYSFDTLIHDIDNGMTIVLIIVLNIIPRIAVFLFLLLIALATISNVKPWKNFCHKYIDLYKILTFGHKNVDTVDARWLLISSMIGMAVFLLFMDGTIINVLTWLVQNVGKLIVR